MTTTRVTWFERDEPIGGTLHVLQVAPADTPRALAQRLVDDLTAMGAPGEVDAGIVPGEPTCLDACQHHDGCDRPCAVVVTTRDPLCGDLSQWEGCYEHARAWVRWCLEDPNRRYQEEPPVVDVEVRVMPGGAG